MDRSVTPDNGDKRPCHDQGVVFRADRYLGRYIHSALQLGSGPVSGGPIDAGTDLETLNSKSGTSFGPIFEEETGHNEIQHQLYQGTQKTTGFN